MADSPPDAQGERSQEQGQSLHADPSHLVSQNTASPEAMQSLGAALSAPPLQAAGVIPTSGQPRDYRHEGGRDHAFAPAPTQAGPSYQYPPFQFRQFPQPCPRALRCTPPTYPSPLFPSTGIWPGVSPQWCPTRWLWWVPIR